MARFAGSVPGGSLRDGRGPDAHANFSRRTAAVVPFKLTCDHESLSSRLGPPDFYPPTADDEEEIISRSTIQMGYKESVEGIEESKEVGYTLVSPSQQWSKPIVARHRDVIRKKLRALNNALTRKRKAGQVYGVPLTGPLLGKLGLYPEQKTFGEEFRRKWMEDLAGRKRLRVLGESVPHGFIRKTLFEALIRYNVPLLRATWYIRTIYLNMWTQTRPMGQNAAGDNSAARRHERWKLDLLQYAESLLNNLCRSSNVSSNAGGVREQGLQPGGTEASNVSSGEGGGSEGTKSEAATKWSYLLRLALWHCSEGLLQRPQLLEWAIAQVQERNCVEALECLLPMLQQLTSCATLSQRTTWSLTDLCLHWLRILCPSGHLTGEKLQTTTEDRLLTPSFFSLSKSAARPSGSTSAASPGEAAPSSRHETLAGCLAELLRFLLVSTPDSFVAYDCFPLPHCVCYPIGHDCPVVLSANAAADGDDGRGSKSIEAGVRASEGETLGVSERDVIGEDRGGLLEGSVCYDRPPTAQERTSSELAASISSRAAALAAAVSPGILRSNEGQAVQCLDKAFLQGDVASACKCIFDDAFCCAIRMGLKPQEELAMSGYHTALSGEMQLNYIAVQFLCEWAVCDFRNCLYDDNDESKKGEVATSDWPRVYMAVSILRYRIREMAKVSSLSTGEGEGKGVAGTSKVRIMNKTERGAAIGEDAPGLIHALLSRWLDAHLLRGRPRDERLRQLLAELVREGIFWPEVYLGQQVADGVLDGRQTAEQRRRAVQHRICLRHLPPPPYLADFVDPIPGVSETSWIDVGGQGGGGAATLLKTVREGVRTDSLNWGEGRSEKLAALGQGLTRCSKKRMPDIALQEFARQFENERHLALYGTAHKRRRVASWSEQNDESGRGNAIADEEGNVMISSPSVPNQGSAGLVDREGGDETAEPFGASWRDNVSSKKEKGKNGGCRGKQKGQLTPLIQEICEVLLLPEACWFGVKADRQGAESGIAIERDHREMVNLTKCARVQASFTEERMPDAMAGKDGLCEEDNEEDETWWMRRGQQEGQGGKGVQDIESQEKVAFTPILCSTIPERVEIGEIGKSDERTASPLSVLHAMHQTAVLSAESGPPSQERRASEPDHSGRVSAEIGKGIQKLRIRDRRRLARWVDWAVRTALSSVDGVSTIEAAGEMEQVEGLVSVLDGESLQTAVGPRSSEVGGALGEASAKYGRVNGRLGLKGKATTGRNILPETFVKGKLTGVDVRLTGERAGGEVSSRLPPRSPTLTAEAVEVNEREEWRLWDEQLSWVIYVLDTTGDFRTLVELLLFLLPIAASSHSAGCGGKLRERGGEVAAKAGGRCLVGEPMILSCLRRYESFVAAMDMVPQALSAAMQAAANTFSAGSSTPIGLFVYIKELLARYGNLRPVQLWEKEWRGKYGARLAAEFDAVKSGEGERVNKALVGEEGRDSANLGVTKGNKVAVTMREVIHRALNEAVLSVAMAGRAKPAHKRVAGEESRGGQGGLPTGKVGTEEIGGEKLEAVSAARERHRAEGVWRSCDVYVEAEKAAAALMEAIKQVQTGAGGNSTEASSLTAAAVALVGSTVNSTISVLETLRADGDTGEEGPGVAREASEGHGLKQTSSGKSGSAQASTGHHSAIVSSTAGECGRLVLGMHWHCWRKVRERLGKAQCRSFDAAVIGEAAAVVQGSVGLPAGNGRQPLQLFRMSPETPELSSALAGEVGSPPPTTAGGGGGSTAAASVGAALVAGGIVLGLASLESTLEHLKLTEGLRELKVGFEGGGATGERNNAGGTTLNSGGVGHTVESVSGASSEACLFWFRALLTEGRGVGDGLFQALMGPANSLALSRLQRTMPLALAFPPAYSIFTTYCDMQTQGRSGSEGLGEKGREELIGNERGMASVAGAAAEIVSNVAFRDACLEDTRSLYRAICGEMVIEGNDEGELVSTIPRLLLEALLEGRLPDVRGGARNGKWQGVNENRGAAEVSEGQMEFLLKVLDELQPATFHWQWLLLRLLLNEQVLLEKVASGSARAQAAAAAADGRRLEASQLCECEKNFISAVLTRLLVRPHAAPLYSEAVHELGKGLEDSLILQVKWVLGGNQMLLGHKSLRQHLENYAVTHKYSLNPFLDKQSRWTPAVRGPTRRRVASSGPGMAKLIHGEEGEIGTEPAEEGGAVITHEDISRGNERWGSKFHRVTKKEDFLKENDYEEDEPDHKRCLIEPFATERALAELVLPCLARSSDETRTSFASELVKQLKQLEQSLSASSRVSEGGGSAGGGGSIATAQGEGVTPKGLAARKGIRAGEFLGGSPGGRGRRTQTGAMESSVASPAAIQTSVWLRLQFLLPLLPLIYMARDPIKTTRITLAHVLVRLLAHRAIQEPAEPPFLCRSSAMQEQRANHGNPSQQAEGRDSFRGLLKKGWNPPAGGVADSLSEPGGEGDAAQLAECAAAAAAAMAGEELFDRLLLVLHALLSGTWAVWLRPPLGSKAQAKPVREVLPEEAERLQNELDRSQLEEPYHSRLQAALPFCPPPPPLTVSAAQPALPAAAAALVHSSASLHSGVAEGAAQGTSGPQRGLSVLSINGQPGRALSNPSADQEVELDPWMLLEEGSGGGTGNSTLGSEGGLQKATAWLKGAVRVRRTGLTYASSVEDEM